MIRPQKPINGFQNLTSSLQASFMATKLFVKHVWTGACWETVATPKCGTLWSPSPHTVRPWKPPITESWQEWETKKSELDLFDTFVALRKFSSHKQTCEKLTIATESLRWGLISIGVA